MSRLSVSVGITALAACLLGDLPRADAAEFKLKIGAGHPPVGLWVATIKDVYMPRVTERAAKAGHKIEWTEAWGGAVCKLGECLEAVEAGLLDIADVHAPTEPAKLLANNFTFFAPFGTPDPRIAAKVVWDVYQSTPALKKVLEDRYKQVFIANGIVGNYGLVTNFKWAKVPELKGRKLAAIGPNIPWLQGTGAVGVQSTLNEAYTSMQTGVYEGWVMLADPILAFKLNEVSKQYVDMDFGCQATPLLTINRDTLRSMPPDLQKIMLDAGKDYNEAMGQVTYEKQVAAVKRMKELGLETRQADEETKRAWAKQLRQHPEAALRGDQQGEAARRGRLRRTSRR